MSSIIHVLPLIFSIFTCLDPDPYSEYGSRSTRVLNADQMWIRIHNNAHDSWFSLTSISQLFGPLLFLGLLLLVLVSHLGRMLEYLVDEAELQRLLRAHELVPVQRRLNHVIGSA